MNPLFIWVSVPLLSVLTAILLSYFAYNNRNDASSSTSLGAILRAGSHLGQHSFYMESPDRSLKLYIDERNHLKMDNRTSWGTTTVLWRHPVTVEAEQRIELTNLFDYTGRCYLMWQASSNPRVDEDKLVLASLTTKSWSYSLGLTLRPGCRGVSMHLENDGRIWLQFQNRSMGDLWSTSTTPHGQWQELTRTRRLQTSVNVSSHAYVVQTEVQKKLDQTDVNVRVGRYGRDWLQLKMGMDSHPGFGLREEDQLASGNRPFNVTYKTVDLDTVVRHQLRLTDFYDDYLKRFHPHNPNAVLWSAHVRKRSAFNRSMPIINRWRPRRYTYRQRCTLATLGLPGTGYSQLVASPVITLFCIGLSMVYIILALIMVNSETVFSPSIRYVLLSAAGSDLLSYCCQMIHFEITSYAEPVQIRRWVVNPTFVESTVLRLIASHLIVGNVITGVHLVLIGLNRLSVMTYTSFLQSGDRWSSRQTLAILLFLWMCPISLLYLTPHHSNVLRGFQMHVSGFSSICNDVVFPKTRQQYMSSYDQFFSKYMGFVAEETTRARFAMDVLMTVSLSSVCLLIVCYFLNIVSNLSKQLTKLKSVSEVTRVDMVIMGRLTLYVTAILLISLTMAYRVSVIAYRAPVPANLETSKLALYAFCVQNPILLTLMSSQLRLRWTRIFFHQNLQQVQREINELMRDQFPDRFEFAEEKNTKTLWQNYRRTFDMARRLGGTRMNQTLPSRQSTTATTNVMETSFVVDPFVIKFSEKKTTTGVVRNPPFNLTTIR